MQDLKITILQSDLYWESIDQNLESFSRQIAKTKEETNLIVLPEMFNTGFTMNTYAVSEKMNGKTMLWMQKQSLEKNCVVTGSLIIEEKGRYFNRLLWICPDGTSCTYDKRHLFRMSGEDIPFAHGHQRIIAELKGWKICPLICYDLRFPAWSRNKWSYPLEQKEQEGQTNQWEQRNVENLKAEYDVLLFIASWPEKRIHSWKSLLIARAIENQAYTVGVNRIGTDGNKEYYSGDSVVLNFKGETLSKTKPNEESAETVTLSYKDLENFRNQFPVGLDADSFKIT